MRSTASASRGDGRLLALNSYENRVYLVQRDDAPPVVAKFYRAGPLDGRADPGGARVRGRTRGTGDSGRRAARARRRARCTTSPTSASPSTRSAAAARRNSTTRPRSTWLGRFIGRIHAVGALRAIRASADARHRDVRRRAARVRARATISCRPICATPTSRSSTWRSPACAIASRARGRLPRCACTAIATRATCCGRWTARTSSTSTTRATDRRSRTCGCCCRATARR